MKLPISFIESTRALMGDEEYQELSVALEQEPPASVRLNSKFPGLAACSSISGRIPWAAEGYYLNQRLTFTFDPLFHAGCYYVQEASSMFVEQVLRRYVTTPVKMLDLCAAPGGKSTHARSVLPEGSLLVANEVIRNRSQILAENLTKWGYADVVVTNNDPSDFSRIGSFFDVILTDVPCSGEGMFRKDPGAIEEWSPENVEICWQRQRRIITDIWPCLKPGGILIYSTCTYNTREDEENITWIRQEFGAEPLPLAVPAEWNITGSLLVGVDAPVYRFLPHRDFREKVSFLAALRKPEEDREADTDLFSPKKKKSKGDTAASLCESKENLAIAESWLASSDEYNLLVNGTAITAFPVYYQNDLDTASSVSPHRPGRYGSGRSKRQRSDSRTWTCYESSVENVGFFNRSIDLRTSHRLSAERGYRPSAFCSQRLCTGHL